VGMIGFSAGAFLAVDVALEPRSEQLAFIAPIYGGETRGSLVPADAPPLFSAVSQDDILVKIVEGLHADWSAADRPSELHVFAGGGHGFGMVRQGLPSDSWTDLFLAWLDQLNLARDRRQWLTASVDEKEPEGEIDVEVETELVDVDGDGAVDIVRETTTAVIDVDGDGVADIVQQTTTVAVDVDGDGIPDIVERTTVTGVDVNRDGTIDEDEIEVETELAARKGLLEEDLEEDEAG